jgi:hypothetical protein
MGHLAITHDRSFLLLQLEDDAPSEASCPAARSRNGENTRRTRPSAHRQISLHMMDL